MNNWAISCDWGSSSFRLKLIDREQMALVGECRTSVGISVIHDKWKKMHASEKVDRESFYLRYLADRIEELAKSLNIPLSGVPVVLSGMASSTIGIRELSYAKLPFAMDGRDAVIHWLTPRDGFNHRMLMISGCSKSTDVMRGEETQLIGLFLLGCTTDWNGITCCVFPGTHSKHMTLSKGKMVDFKTYMTGEIFHLAAYSSILKDTVAPAEKEQKWSVADQHAFRRGVTQSISANPLNTLFSVRVNGLCANIMKTENYYYLSGLLIGSELDSLRGSAVDQIVLCSEMNAHEPYLIALEELGLAARTIFVEPAIVELAAPAGQVQILNENEGYDGRPF